MVPLGGLATAGALDLMSEAPVVGNAIPAALPDVWFTLPSVFEALQVEPVVVDANALLMGNSEFITRPIEGRRLSSYLDCGSGLAGPNADTYVVTLQWMLQLEVAPGGGTMVTTLLDAYARPRDVPETPSTACPRERSSAGPAS